MRELNHGGEMRGISLWQPWASLIALGCKTMETRSWCPSYRGELAIAATKSIPREYRSAAQVLMNLPRIAGFLHPHGYHRLEDLPSGMIVARSRLVNCLPTDHEFVAGRRRRWPYEDHCGDYTPGRFAWILSDIDGIQPVPASGAQGLWKVPDELAALIRSAKPLP
jgi:hypothetical protein